MASPVTHRSEAGPDLSSCSRCHLASRCAAAPEVTPGPFHGAPLVVAALVFFLAPAGLALLGAAVAGDDAPSQLLGGAAGLLLGMLGAALGARRYATVIAEEECYEPR